LHFLFAIDELTDTADVAQLAISFRDFDENSFITEEFLQLVSMLDSTTKQITFQILSLERCKVSE